MCEVEQWRDVVGYEGLYQVSNMGRVRSVDRVVRHYLGGPKRLKGRVLQSIVNGGYGHLVVGLCKKVSNVVYMFTSL